MPIEIGVKQELKNRLDWIMDTITLVRDGTVSREEGEEAISHNLGHMKFKVQVLFDLIELDRGLKALNGEGM